MTDDGPLHARTQRAQQARELLANPMLQEAFTELGRLYLERAKHITADDDIGRFRVIQAAIVLDKVLEHVKAYVEDDKVAEAELKALQRGNDRRKILGVV